MKLVYIGATGCIVYLIRYKEPFKSKYDSTQDSFLHIKYGVLPCSVLAVVTQLIG